MKKLRLKSIISMMILFIICMKIMCIQVYAAELELEPQVYESGNPYRFKFSYTWTSKGQTIQSYDVSESGRIAVAFSNNTIGVFDRDMNFLYQLSFECSGASGVLWMGEKLLFIDLRSNMAVVCDNYGRTESFYEITGPDNYYYEVVEERIRKQGNDWYFCANGNERMNSLIHYGSYRILKRIPEEGVEEILYKADTLFGGGWGVFAIVLCFVLAAVVCIFMMKRNLYKQYRKKENGRMQATEIKK